MKGETVTPEKTVQVILLYLEAMQASLNCLHNHFEDGVHDDLKHVELTEESSEVDQIFESFNYSDLASPQLKKAHMSL